MLIIAASETARAVDEGQEWLAGAWAARAAHLSRTARETERRRERYQRRKATQVASLGPLQGRTVASLGPVAVAS